MPSPISIKKGVDFMQTVIEALREIIGVPEFYVKLGSQTNYTWDYGAMIEYFVAALILMIVISSVFRLITKIFIK